MAVPAALLGVIIIWATTPLAIKWSGEEVGFLFGIASRIIISALLAWMLLRLLRMELPWHREARNTYFAVAVGVYGAMMGVYWGAQYIDSGLVSVIFGLTPLFTGVMAAFWLQEDALRPNKLVGMLFGVAGLALVFMDGLALGSSAFVGIAAVLVATVLHSLSGVLVKRVNPGLPVMATLTGGLLVSALLYAVTWLIFSPPPPEQLPLRSAGAILYLALFGSLLGFYLFYYVLKHVQASRVALITLVTPVAAIGLGVVFNDESLRPQVILGTGLILAGLLMYQYGQHLRRGRREVTAEVVERLE